MGVRKKTIACALALLAVLPVGRAVAAQGAVVWQDCGGGFECTSLAVPLSYRGFDDRTIALPVVRHRASDPANRIGTLLLQPGGPGGSGVDFARDAFDGLPAELREQFDVVGFDPRGVGVGAQLACWDDVTYGKHVSKAKGRPGPEAFGTAVELAAQFNAACAQNSGDLLPYVGTDHVARDIDSLRRALGEEQLTFYGRSFGTFVGTVYADLFPGRVRAMALDGAYDPAAHTDRPYSADLAQYLALDGAAGRFLDWCAATPQRCGFGGGDPRGAFRRLTGGPDGFTVAYRVMFSLNEGRAGWPELAHELRRAEAGDRGSSVLRTPGAAAFDFLTPNVVIECADRVYSGNLKHRLRAAAAAAPLLGPALAYGPPTYDHNHATACAQWPAERRSRHVGPWTAAGSAPILVLGTTGDPDTPYRDAVALARKLDNARLLTFDAEGHTAFDRSRCARRAVTAYLTELTLPPRDLVCADESSI